MESNGTEEGEPTSSRASNVKALAAIFQNKGLIVPANGQRPVSTSVASSSTRRFSAPEKSSEGRAGTVNRLASQPAIDEESASANHTNTTFKPAANCRTSDSALLTAANNSYNASSNHKDTQPPTANQSNEDANVRRNSANSSSSGRPVPRPRFSVLRKKWYSELNFDDDDEESKNESPPSADIYSEGDEGIYEVLDDPSNWSGTDCRTNGQAMNGQESVDDRKAARQAAASKNFRDTLQSLLQKSKRLSNKLPEKQIKRTLSAFAKSCDTLLTSTEMLGGSNGGRFASNKPPRPPSIEQLINRPLVQPNRNYSQSYSDSVEPEELYASVEESDSSDYYQRVGEAEPSEEDEIYADAEDFDYGQSGQYYDDEQIYETIGDQKEANPSSASMSNNDNGNQYYDHAQTGRQRMMSSSEQKKIDREQRAIEKQRQRTAQKLKTKFNMTGEEVPINWGHVRNDAPKTRLGLKVKKDEIVLILRMENNPPGKWLAKNERSKIGYVDLRNIAFDPESVRLLMNINNNPLRSPTDVQAPGFAGGEPVSLDTNTKC